MNVTHIFLNNGQWNWDAIGTISNIILVGALVIVTGWYAKRQTKLMGKEKERKRILEGVQHVLTPGTYNIKREIDAITNGTRISFGQKFHEFFNGEVYYRYAFWDIIEEFTDLPAKLRSNDKLSDKLNRLYTKIGTELTSEFEGDNFKEHLTDMMNEFNRSNPDAFGTNTRSLSHLEEFCKKYIISKCDLNNIFQTEGREDEFFKKYKDELLKYRNLPRIEELCKEIKDTLNKLKKSDGDILERFTEIIKKYRKDYHFSEEEINPGIMQEREFFKKFLP